MKTQISIKFPNTFHACQSTAVPEPKADSILNQAVRSIAENSRAEKRLQAYTALLLNETGVDKLQARQSLGQLLNRMRALGYDGNEHQNNHLIRGADLGVFSMGRLQLVLADYYEVKYGVKIFLHLGSSYVIPALEWVYHKLLAHPGQALGFVFHSNRYSRDIESFGASYSTRVRDSMLTETTHQTPLVFVLVGGQVQSLELDSIGGRAFRESEIHDFFHARTGRKPSIYFQTAFRQSDRYSCHTEAMVVLKNVLLRVNAQETAHLADAFQLLMDDISLADEAPPSSIEPSTEAADLTPKGAEVKVHPSLLKTAQRVKALGDLNLANMQLLNPQKSDHTTLGQHRARFDRFTPPCTQPRNHYLFVKGHHVADTALKILETLPDFQSREAYLNALIKKHTG